MARPNHLRAGPADGSGGSAASAHVCHVRAECWERSSVAIGVHSTDSPEASRHRGTIATPRLCDSHSMPLHSYSWVGHSHSHSRRCCACRSILHWRRVRCAKRRAHYSSARGGLVSVSHSLNVSALYACSWQSRMPLYAADSRALARLDYLAHNLLRCWRRASRGPSPPLFYMRTFAFFAPRRAECTEDRGSFALRVPLPCPLEPHPQLAAFLARANSEPRTKCARLAASSLLSLLYDCFIVSCVQLYSPELYAYSRLIDCTWNRDTELANTGA